MVRLLGRPILACLIALAAALTACGAGLPKLVPASGLPVGWRSLRYGALQVAVPSGWRIIGRDRVPICGLPPSRSITVGTYDHDEAISCPAIRPTPGLAYLRLVCETGSAARLYSTSGPTLEVGRAVMREASDNSWNLEVRSTVTELTIQLPPAERKLGHEIMSTVTTTGRGC